MIVAIMIMVPFYNLLHEEKGVKPPESEGCRRRGQTL